MMGSRVFFVFALFLLVAPTAAQQKRPITERDLFAFVWVADPQISADGSQVAFVRATADEKRDTYDTDITHPTSG